MQPKQVGIVGYGRFGRFWADLLRKYHTVWVTDAVPFKDDSFLPVEELCERVEVLFFCVPIGRLEAALTAVRDHLRPGTIIFDTCSVKQAPAAWMLENLSSVERLTLVATHPMFGPDSARSGVESLPMMTWFLSGDKEDYTEWHGFFEGLGLRVVEISPETHDRLAAYSQGVTHYIGRVLGELDLKPTPIDTQGFSILLSLIEQTCNDSWELFHDLQIHNPYTREMRLALEGALDEVYAALLPERVDANALIIGVQGGEGSFSEEAGQTYIAGRSASFPKSRIAYLFTTKNVLQALHRGEIDFGVFAIQNAAGGVVMESVLAMSETNCAIIEMFDLVINHSIMHHPETAFKDVDTLISHPQALAQCKRTLRERHPHLKQVSGEGDLIDQALCAKELSSGGLPKTTAVLAPRVCADKFGLTIHDDGLQDLGDKNLTTFVWATRKPRRR